MRPTCVRTTNVQLPTSVLLTTISPLPVGKTSGLIYPLTLPLSTSSFTNCPVIHYILHSVSHYLLHLTLTIPLSTSSCTHYHVILYIFLSLSHFPPSSTHYLVIHYILHSLSYHPLHHHWKSSVDYELFLSPSLREEGCIINSRFPVMLLHLPVFIYHSLHLPLTILSSSMSTH